MKKNLIIIAALSLLFSCDKDDDSPAPSKAELLAGKTQRSWYIYATTPEDLQCPSSADDTWTFFRDGTFEYDHGTETMDTETSCVDFVNFVGTWELLDNEKSLKIVADHLKDDPSITISETIGEGELRVINDDKFIIVANPSTTKEQSIEFRRR